MLNVAIVSRGIPTQDNPMNGIFEWDQAQALKRAGVKVTFIVLDLRSLRRKRNWSTTVCVKDGIQIVKGSVPLGNIPASLFYYLGKRKLKKLIDITIAKYGRPDVIHGHFSDIGAIAAAEAKRRDIPCVVTEHSSSINLDILLRRTRFFASRAYSNASLVITVSQSLRTRLSQHFNINSIVIPNVVDTSAIRYQNRQSISILNRKIFVATGNLLYRKGYDVLVSSFAKLPKNKAELWIIGDGVEKQKLKTQIKQLGADDNIKLLGFKNRKEISDLYSQADCFVLASRRETFGVVYIEAMLAGVPVIATRCGGPEDFVNSSNGLLVDPENTEQLFEALLKMVHTSDSYSSQSIHDFAVKTFSPEVIAQKLISCYKSIL